MCYLQGFVFNMRDLAGQDRSLSAALKAAVFVLSGMFLLLGALCLLAPAVAARFYGLEADAPSALFYVRAIGLRDAALALYLFGLALAGRSRALAIVAFGTLIIPLGDILLLAASGAGAPVHYLLHGASLLCFAALAWWSSRVGRAHETARKSEGAVGNKAER